MKNVPTERGGGYGYWIARDQRICHSRNSHVRFFLRLFIFVVDNNDNARWNPAVEMQAVHRAYRIGQVKFLVDATLPYLFNLLSLFILFSISHLILTLRFSSFFFFAPCLFLFFFILDQFKPVNATRFITKDSVEEKMLQLQQKKQLVFEGTMDGSATSLAKLTAEDLAFLFHS